MYSSYVLILVSIISVVSINLVIVFTLISFSIVGIVSNQLANIRPVVVADVLINSWFYRCVWGSGLVVFPRLQACSVGVQVFWWWSVIGLLFACFVVASSFTEVWHPATVAPIKPLFKGYDFTVSLGGGMEIFFSDAPVRVLFQVLMWFAFTCALYYALVGLVQRSLFYTWVVIFLLTTLLLCSFLIVCVTHLVVLVCALEISAFSMLFLFLYVRRVAGVSTASWFFILNGVVSIVSFTGISCLKAGGFSLDLSQLGSFLESSFSVSTALEQVLFESGGVLLLFSLFLKLGFYPFTWWSLRIYTAVPVPLVVFVVLVQNLGLMWFLHTILQTLVVPGGWVSFCVFCYMVGSIILLSILTGWSTSLNVFFFTSSFTSVGYLGVVSILCGSEVSPDFTVTAFQVDQIWVFGVFALVYGGIEILFWWCFITLLADNSVIGGDYTFNQVVGYLVFGRYLWRVLVWVASVCLMLGVPWFFLFFVNLQVLFHVCWCFPWVGWLSTANVVYLFVGVSLCLNFLYLRVLFVVLLPSLLSLLRRN